MESEVPPRTRLSPYLHRFDQIVAHSAAVGFMAALVGASGIALIATGFPAFWESLFSWAAWSVTLVMLFLVHHTQRREQVATQLKLDELIRALPQADDHYVRVQAAADEEVQELEERHIEHHRATRSG
ncbi:MAG TPA: low affinity iron permease family protein [Acidimicrobiia bacterium]|nr:low affinity iron permease family protein [Acidimicrobiia bacterium]